MARFNRLVDWSLRAAGAGMLVGCAHGGDIVGKVVTGYQGWLSAPADGSAVNQWKHTNLECWPDVREYTTTFSGVPFKQAGVTQPGYVGNLGNGQPAVIFSSWSDQTVNKHFEWMRHYGGIDCVALQRFGSELGNAPLKSWKNGIAGKVRGAAETYGRKYYIMYDISGWTNFQSDIKTDWAALEADHVNSPAYAREGGKPVVCVWGMGFSGRPGNAQSWKDVLDWFKARGCYVIGGLAQGFHSDSRSYTDPATSLVTTNQQAFRTCDMVMVWVVGRSGGFGDIYSDGLDWCAAHGKEYQADIYPGTAFYNTDFASDPTATRNKRPRNHGDFMWSQFAAAREMNVRSVYISMFDELQEATQIFKTAEDSSMIPDGKYFLTLDADGVACSADFYLRLTKDGADMVKGNTPYVTAHPTPHRIFGNLVMNSSFEAGGANPTFWVRGGSAAGSTASAQSGGASLRIATAGANEPTTQTIPVQTGKSYQISVWINASGMASGNAVFDTADQYDGPGQGQFVINSLNSGWTRYSGSFTAAGPSLTLRMFTGSTFGGTVDFDNILLQRSNDVPMASPQSVSTEENAARAITLSGSDTDGDPLTYAVASEPENGLLSGSVPDLIYTPKAGYFGPDNFTFKVNDGAADSATATVSITVIPPVAANLVLNSSFEAGGSAPTSWIRGGSAVGSTESAQDGLSSLKIAAAGINNPTRQAIPIEIGKSYQVSVWINASGMTSGKAVFDTSDKYDGTGQGQFVINSANAGWTKYSGGFTATTSSVTLRMFTEANFSGTVYFDNLSITETPVLTFSSWMSGFFEGMPGPAVTGFNADPDRDGLANGLEFVLGGNPAVNDAAGIMPAGEKDGGNYVFTFKRTDVSEATTQQIVQYASNPGVWSDIAISATAGSSGGATYTVAEGSPSAGPDTIVVTIPHAAADRFFVRLKVVEP